MKLADFSFRAFDTEKKSYADLEITSYGSTGVLDIGAYPYIEIELYTGYTDTKGTRIYENDIIHTDKGDKFVVVQDGLISAWGLLDSYYCPCCSLAEVMFESECVQVLGNIHENAELLKGQK